MRTLLSLISRAARNSICVNSVVRRTVVTNSQPVSSIKRRKCRMLMHNSTQLRQTGLYDFHVQHGAKMVPFAGYSMPLLYGDVGQGKPCIHSNDEGELTTNLVASHHHVRNQAGLFDVGHMVQTTCVLHHVVLKSLKHLTRQFPWSNRDHIPRAPYPILAFCLACVLVVAFCTSQSPRWYHR